MTDNADFGALLAVREDQYMRLARTMAPAMLELPPRLLAVALSTLLLDAYRDGGRDMHKAVLEILNAEGIPT